jgi:DNA-binding CsgD family transcriptional regulator
MDATTEIAIFFFAFLQLSISVLILWVTSDRSKAKLTDGGKAQTDDVDQKTFSAKCQSYYLTSREIEILHLVGEGLPYKLIASQLNISEHTVNTHIKNMFAKVGVTNKMELVGRVVSK